MRRLFNDLPIGRKLNAIVLATTAFSLLIACATILIRDVNNSRDSMRVELGRLAEIVGTNCTPTLHFRDPASAELIMAALASEPSIDRAILVTPDNDPFAVYQREGFVGGDATSLLEAPGGFLDGAFMLRHRIVASGEHIGSLIFEANLDSIHHRIRRDLVAITIILALSLVLATIVSQRLQRIVSGPISQLAETAFDVSVRHDYSVRAQKHGEDELGLLVDGFNAMLSRVEERDADLREYGAVLEEAVRERTAKLRTTNKELLKTMEAAQESSRLKSDFVANMSHELRTPMNAIIGMTDLALETGLNPDQSEMLRIVATSADSLLHLLNDILDFSKIEAKGIVLAEEPFELRRTVGGALRALAAQAHSKQLELLCEVDGDIPVRFLGDSGRLRQIVINLIGNAIKFTDTGQVLLSADLEDEKTVHFRVRDTGCGIPLDRQELIFESFTQVDGSHSRSYGGTGLGLAISKELVNLMGGKIWVESAPGEGSVFHFTAQFDTFDQDSAPPISPAELSGIRALVVDDNSTNLRITSALLERWGMRSTSVDSGAAALDAMREAVALEDPYRLILLDASMPSMNGEEVARAIHSDVNLRRSTVVMLSSHGRRRKTDTTAAGIAAYLVKPVFEDDLLSVVQSVLGEAGRVEPDAPVLETAIARPRRSLRILAAEDNYMNQRLLERILARQGHEVVSAVNGREALAAHELESFDLILMDVQMPEIDGLEATRKIRAREAERGVHTPIVALTANAMKGDRERCLKAGTDEYMSKPLNKEVLFGLIEELCYHEDPIPASGGTDRHQDVEQVFNQAQALSLCDDDWEFVREVVELFLHSSNDLIRALEDAIASAEPEAVYAAAHTLKGAASNIGAERVQNAAKHLMEMSSESQLEGSEETLVELQKHHAELVHVLEGFLSQIAERAACAS